MKNETLGYSWGGGEVGSETIDCIIYTYYKRQCFGSGSNFFYYIFYRKKIGILISGRIRSGSETLKTKFNLYLKSCLVDAGGLGRDL